MPQSKGPIGKTTPRKQQKNRSRSSPLAQQSSSPSEYGPGTPVAIYSRVSTDEQAEKGLSLSAQRRTCEQFAASRGWQVVRVYEDPGFTGKNDKRPGFQNMLAGAANGEFKILLVHKLDRFSRSIENTLKNFKVLNSCDVTLVSATEAFDYSTPQGRMFFHMMAVFAQWYLENLSAETSKGKYERVRQGLHNGRLPFGYRSGGPKKPGVVVPEEAEAVRKAFELCASGNFTDRQIAAYLHEHGFRTRKGRRWSKDTVREMLQNDFYYGVVTYKDEVWPGKHEPIISKELFDRCAAVRRQRGRRPKSYNSKPKRFYLLQRIIRCDRCERHLRMQTSKKYHYYKESSLERGLICEHAGKSIRMDRADQQVLDILKSLRLPLNWQEIIENTASEMSIGHQVEKERQKIRRQLRRLGEIYQDGIITQKEYVRQRDTLQAQLMALIVPDDATLMEYGLQIEQLGPYLKEATEAEKAEISHLLLEAVYFDLESGQIVRLKSKPDFLHIFHLVAQEMGWQQISADTWRL